jgi:hypothetical protein
VASDAPASGTRDAFVAPAHGAAVQPRIDTPRGGAMSNDSPESSDPLEIARPEPELALDKQTLKDLNASAAADAARGGAKAETVSCNTVCTLVCHIFTG